MEKGVSPAMEKSRLEFLEEAVRGDPDHAFMRYGLAMELKNAGRETEAWTHFEYLLAHQPEYAATYAQAGMLLAKLGRVDEARSVFQKGIEVTGQQGKVHARDELQAALDDL